MKLADKIRYLREVEGNLRGLGRAMTQQELVKAIAEDTGTKNGARKTTRGETISQSYLSQIESGARPHLTNTTRLLLARFFKVHPGYLVDDPDGYQAELMSDARNTEDKLDLWLIAGAERFHRDPALCGAILALANHVDSRRCLLLLESIIDTPGLVDRLCDALKPQVSGAGQRNSIAKQDQASTTRVLRPPAEMATTSLAANAEDGRSRKGAARRKSK
jgi:transcriptional regulator with XRE-family HTH domain